MKALNTYLIVLSSVLLTNCISQSQYQTAVVNTKRLEQLIEKERSENDQLNAQRSVMESQIQSLNNQIVKLQADKQSINETYNVALLKAKEDKTKYETKIKALETTINQQTENNQKIVAALDEKIGDLAEDKRELINEKYAARKKVVKKRKRRR
jgi:peptidoglycan hydrolase CwlO-like protein